MLHAEFGKRNLNGNFDKFNIGSPNSLISVNTDGAYITNWITKVNGKLEPVLYSPGSELKRTGIPTLFPNYGSVKGFKNHGFGRTSVWDLDSLSTNQVMMSLTHEKISPEDRELFPYPFKATIIASAPKDGSLRYQLNVQNLGLEPMPIRPGQHSYIAIPHQEKPNMKVENVSGFDPATIDWDNSPPDTFYAFNRIARFYYTNRNNQPRILTIEDESAQKTVTGLVAWAQKAPNADLDMVALETVTRTDDETQIDRSVMKVERSSIIIPPHGIWRQALRFSFAAA